MHILVWPIMEAFTCFIMLYRGALRHNVEHWTPWCHYVWCIFLIPDSAAVTPHRLQCPLVILSRNKEGHTSRKGRSSSSVVKNVTASWVRLLEPGTWGHFCEWYVCRCQLGNFTHMYLVYCHYVMESTLVHSFNNVDSLKSSLDLSGLMLYGLQSRQFRSGSYIIIVR